MKRVTQQQAEWLKSIGFKEDVNAYYHDEFDDNLMDTEFVWNDNFGYNDTYSIPYHNYNKDGGNISAPYVSQALNWLADEKNINAQIVKAEPYFCYYGVCNQLQKFNVNQFTDDAPSRELSEVALLELIYENREKLGLI